MSHENDSFIDEVTEELRRDRLFKSFRRYGWIGALAILAIVGGAAWREYSIAKSRAAAQNYGDAVVAALGTDDPAAALAAVDAGDKPARQVLDKILAAGVSGEDSAAQRQLLLDAAAEAGAENRVMRDLALLKLVIAQGNNLSAAERDGYLAQIAQPGAPFELLGLEQQAVALIGAGRQQDAITLIRQIQQKDGLTQGLRQRLSEMMIAMGANNGPEAAAAGGAVTADQ